MISELELKQLDELQHIADIEECVKIVTGSDNPFFLLECAQLYNWDDGFDVVNAIANNKHCELSIGLSLFWLADAVSYLTGEIVRNEYNSEWAEFCEILISRIESGEYKCGILSFDPQLGKVEKYKLRKLGIPEVFLNEVEVEK